MELIQIAIAGCVLSGIIGIVNLIEFIPLFFRLGVAIKFYQDKYYRILVENKVKYESSTVERMIDAKKRRCFWAFFIAAVVFVLFSVWAYSLNMAELSPIVPMPAVTANYADAISSSKQSISI